MRANSVIASSSPLTTVPAAKAAQHALAMQGIATPPSPPPNSARQNRLPPPPPPSAPTTEMSSFPSADTGKERSLQINIDSEDDARAVIQHLQAVKDAYDLLAATNGITSIEFAINENVARKVESTLYGAVPWTHTYTKLVKPFDGNVLFPLPHFQHLLTEEQRNDIAAAVNHAANAAARAALPALPLAALLGTAFAMPVLDAIAAPAMENGMAAVAAIKEVAGAAPSFSAEPVMNVAPPALPKTPGNNKRPVPAATAAG